MSSLRRSDIVNRAVAQVLQTPWIPIAPGNEYLGCEGIVQLDTGVVFSISAKNYFEDNIEHLDLRKTKTIPFDFGTQETCVGETIQEVLLSESWCPFSLGLLLSSKRVFCINNSPWSSGPILVDEAWYRSHGALVFWDHKPFVRP